MVKKIIESVFILLIVISFGFAVYSLTEKNIYTNKNTRITKIKQIKKDDNLKFLTITEKDLENDLKQYRHLSSKKRKMYLTSILNISKKYEINPLILYSIIATESSFKHWIKHNPVYVNVGKKRIKTRAVGLGGIIYEIHKDDLIKNKIIEVKEDLYDPVTNIEATAFIYKKYIQMPLKKGVKNKYQSGLLRYFGGNYKSYVKKIENKMGKIVFNKIYK